MNTSKKIDSLIQEYIYQTSRLNRGEDSIARMRSLMAFLGNPQADLNVIHLAGTSGKTSTAYYVSALLTEASAKVGLCISPHSYSITERVQINTQPLLAQSFYSQLRAFTLLVKKSQIKISYFELMYAFAIWLFAKERVDYAVIETGMGGSIDPTNVTDSKNKVCVITDIGFDHTKALGSTLREIAAHKAGIIKQGNTVISYSQPPEVAAVIKARVKLCQAKLAVVPSPDPDADIFVASLPLFQKRNWWLAYNVYLNLAQKDGLPKLNHTRLQRTQMISIPGRMQIVDLASKTLILDCAHNVQKMAALADSFRAMYSGQKATFLLAFKGDKDIKGVGAIIKDLAEMVVVTKFASSIDQPARAYEPKYVASVLSSYGIKNVIVETNAEKAFNRALSQSSQFFIISGSIFLISQLGNEEPLSQARSKLNGLPI